MNLNLRKMYSNLTYNKLTDIFPFDISSRLVHNGNNYSSLQALRLAEKENMWF